MWIKFFSVQSSILFVLRVIKTHHPYDDSSKYNVSIVLLSHYSTCSSFTTQLVLLLEHGTTSTKEGEELTERSIIDIFVAFCFISKLFEQK